MLFTRGYPLQTSGDVPTPVETSYWFPTAVDHFGEGSVKLGYHKILWFVT